MTLTKNAGAVVVYPLSSVTQCRGEHRAIELKFLRARVLWNVSIILCSCGLRGKGRQSRRGMWTIETAYMWRRICGRRGWASSKRAPSQTNRHTAEKRTYKNDPYKFMTYHCAFVFHVYLYLALIPLLSWPPNTRPHSYSSPYSYYMGDFTPFPSHLLFPVIHVGGCFSQGLLD